MERGSWMQRSPKPLPPGSARFLRSRPCEESGCSIFIGKRENCSGVISPILPLPAHRSTPLMTPEALYTQKRDMSWVGYKVHVAETCDDDAPHLLTHIETTPASQA